MAQTLYAAQQYARKFISAPFLKNAFRGLIAIIAGLYAPPRPAPPRPDFAGIRLIS
jgi:hypothetical protein